MTNIINGSVVFYDSNNVIIGWAMGSTGSDISMSDCTTAIVSDIPNDCVYASHKYDPETGEIYVNPDYETETAAGKEYVINVGWVYPEENGNS